MGLGPEYDTIGPALVIRGLKDWKDVVTYGSEVSIHRPDCLEHSGAAFNGDYSGPLPFVGIEAFVGNKVEKVAHCCSNGMIGAWINDRDGFPRRIAHSWPKWMVCGYGAWRSFRKTSLSGVDFDLDPCSHLFSNDTDLINPEEWLLRMDYGSQKAPVKVGTALRHRLDSVKAVLKEILPGVIGVEIVPPAEWTDSTRVLFETWYGKVEMSQLGHGYKSLLTWLVDFSARMYAAYPESENPLAEAAVCLVDEIDLHLHPSWQRKLLRFLSERYPKTQFIATAHSPLIVQAAEEIGANVVVLRREGDHVVIDNDPISVKGWRVDQILSSELFDDTPLRDAESEKWMARRVELLQKDKLTAKEKAELKQLNEKVRELPMASSPEDRNLDRRLKAAVELLEKAAKRTK